MTEDFASFEEVIEFYQPKTKNSFLVLEKANLSSLPEKEEKIKIPVKF
jgi:hypothetical protein